MRNEKSDEKFIEWSRNRTPKDWDVTIISKFLEASPSGIIGLDIGGGVGIFSKNLIQSSKNIASIDVVDPAESVKSNFVQHEKVNLKTASLKDFQPECERYDFILVNLVLHHIIGVNNTECDLAQAQFLDKVRTLLKDSGTLFVQENIYESAIGIDVCGRIIFEITRLKLIQNLVRRLGANTAGEGVRFHSDEIWLKFFETAGFNLQETHVDLKFGEYMPFWQKLFLACSGRYQKIYIMQKN